MTEASVFHALVWAWFGVAAVTVVSLLWLSAPYGRHTRAGWGPMIPARIGWIVMELPAVVTISLCFAVRPPSVNAVWLMFGLWQLHYIHRALVFPFRMRGGHKPMPLAISAMAVFFNVVNGYLNGRWLTKFGSYDATWLVDPRFVAGAAVMLAGFAINLRADATLRSLRAPGESGYKIPAGGLYRYVSCPNYLGEIIEWTGWAVLTWSVAGLSFAVWTAANLAPRAWTHHRWYRATFPDYPKTRRALVPFVL
jgi:steroid 5-alpha-reductase/3-oxo-5-alpha-steroid 4-dehydrogenase 1